MSIFITGSWCIDEPAITQEKAPPAPTQPVPTKEPEDGWPRLIASILDILLPHREAYQAVFQFLRNTMDALPA